MPLSFRYSAKSAAMQDEPLSLSSLGLATTVALSHPEALSARSSVALDHCS